MLYDRKYRGAEPLRVPRRKDEPVQDEHALPRVPDYPPADLGHEDCACVTPVPVQRAERKGAARTVCARCGRPVPLRFA